MDNREFGRVARAVFFLVVALVFGLGSIVVAELAWIWWAHPCKCITSQSPIPNLGPLCADTCISIGPLSVSESAGGYLFAVVLPLLGMAAAAPFEERFESAWERRRAKRAVQGDP